MQRRKFSREFKVEAVKLFRDRGVSVAQAARDLDVHENVLRKWVKEFGSHPVQAFPDSLGLKSFRRFRRRYHEIGSAAAIPRKKPRR
jgi:transposase